MSRHRTLSGESVHGPYRNQFANEAARLADSSTYLASESIAGGSTNPAISFQIDTSEQYILANHSPISWTLMLAGSTAGDFIAEAFTYTDTTNKV